jgi:hypothetical protein
MGKLFILMLLMSNFCYSQSSDSTAKKPSEKFSLFKEQTSEIEAFSAEEIDNINYRNLKKVKSGGGTIFLGSLFLIADALVSGSDSPAKYLGIGLIGIGGIKLATISIPMDWKPKNNKSKRK